MILIVDDSLVSRMLIRNIIRDNYPQAELIEAAHGEDALEKVQTLDVKIAVIDYNMPGMDGLMLASRLKTDFPLIRIGLLTANIQSVIRDKAAQLGIQFIPKPITSDKIMDFLDG